MRNGNLFMWFFYSNFRYFSSYPTYEEWKPTKKIDTFPPFMPVLILPMRNGNRNKSPKVTLLSIATVLILPMRNGNFNKT